MTGGAGFVGSHIADRLIEDGHKVRVLDNLSAGCLENLRDLLGREGFHFMKGDVADPSTLRKALKNVEVVFHEAALVTVPRSIVDPIPTNEVNVTGTLRLLKASADLGVQRLIYASSSSVYGDCGKRKIKEDSIPRPMSPYAVSKLAAENYCLTFNTLDRLETVNLRYFNVYGPRQSVGPYSGVITAFQDRLRKSQPPIIQGDGRQTRDFVHVRDVVEANMLAMAVKKAAGEAFNIGTGLSTSISKLAEIIIEARGREKIRPVYAPPRRGDVRHSCADIGKARRILGYSPTVRLRDYVRELAGKGHQMPVGTYSSIRKP